MSDGKIHIPARKRKPAPDSILIMMDTLKCKPEETIYVGDSEVDVEAAANAGIRCASVTWGFRDKEDLEKINPLYIADNVQELYEYSRRTPREKRPDICDSITVG